MLGKDGFFYKTILALIFVSLIYSVSYQQHRHFKALDPRGLDDSKIYIKMSRGEKVYSHLHAYRFVIPKIVSFIRPIANNLPYRKNFEEKNLYVDKTIFYIVNLIITTITTYVLFFYLRALGIPIIGSFLGTLIFITSRVTIYTVGATLVDSAQFLSVIIICYAIVKDKVRFLSLLNPLLIISKETIVPLLILPFFKKSFLKGYYYLSILLSFSILVTTRSIISRNLINISDGEQVLNIFQVLTIHAQLSIQYFKNLFSVTGIHDLIFSTFSFFIFAAVMGFFINKKSNYINIPYQIMLILPYSLFLVLLSGNYGRMFMISFPVIIPYASIFLIKFFPLSDKKLNNKF